MTTRMRSARVEDQLVGLDHELEVLERLHGIHIVDRVLDLLQPFVCLALLCSLQLGFRDDALFGLCLGRPSCGQRQYQKQ